MPVPVPTFTSTKKNGNTLDVTPKFKGGTEALMSYLGVHINYPGEAKKNKIEGKVYLAFLVDVNGNIKDLKIVKSAHKLLSTEAIIVVKSMPKWIPKKKIGKI